MFVFKKQLPKQLWGTKSLIFLRTVRCISEIHLNWYFCPSYLKVKVKSFSRSWLFVTLWTVCSPPFCFLYGIFQAGILEWVAISFSRGSSRPRNQTGVSRSAGRRFTVWATREVLFKNDVLEFWQQVGWLSMTTMERPRGGLDLSTFRWSLPKPVEERILEVFCLE